MLMKCWMIKLVVHFNAMLLRHLHMHVYRNFTSAMCAEHYFFIKLNSNECIKIMSRTFFFFLHLHWFSSLILNLFYRCT